MKVTKTKIETMVEVGVTNEYHKRVHLILQGDFVSHDMGSSRPSIKLTRAETSQLIRALKRQRDRKGVR